MKDGLVMTLIFIGLALILLDKLFTDKGGKA